MNDEAVRNPAPTRQGNVPPSDVAGHPPQRSHRRRAILIGTAVCLAGLLGIFARFAYLRFTRYPTPRPEYWAARVAAIDPPPPGAISWDDAAKLLADAPWRSDPAVAAIRNFDPETLVQGTWDAKRPEVAAAIRVFRSDEFRTARENLMHGVTAGWYEPPDLSPGPMFASFQHYRQWNRWLVARSRWARAANPDKGPAAAVDDWLTTLRLARQVGRPRMARHQYLEASIRTRVAKEMMLASSESTGILDTSQLARRIDEITGPERHPADLMLGERLWRHSVLEYAFVREGGDWLDVSECGAVLAASNGLLGRKPPRIWNLASPLFHSLPAARASVDACFDAADTCTTLVTCRAAEEDAPNGTGARPGVLDGSVDSGWDWPRSPFSYYCSYCSLDAAVTMLAIEQYRLREGGYPERLAAIVPAFLPRMPVDYADRQPLRYRRTADGYLLYSIGFNGKDDGGTAGAARNPWSFDASNPDVVFSGVRREKIRQ